MGTERTRNDFDMLPEVYSWQRTKQWSDNPDHPFPEYGQDNTNNKLLLSTSGRWRGITDIVTPNFKALSAKGHIINNPMNTWRNGWENPLIYWTFAEGLREGTGWCYERWGEYHASSFSDGFWFTDLNQTIDVVDVEQSAVSKAFANTSVTEAQALATLAELPETIKFVTTVFPKVIRILRKVKKLRFKDISFDELSDLYLGYRYALRPLVYEVRDYLEAFNNEIYKPRLRFLGSEQDISTQYHERRGLTSRDFDYVVNVDAIETGEIVVRSRAGVLAEVKLDDLLNVQVFGLDNFLQTAWEIVPFSFIVDWFVNVADVLASWNPNCILDPLAAWVVTDVEVSRSFKPLSAEFEIFDKTFNMGIVPGGVWKEYWVTKTRTPQPLKPPVTPNININLDSLKLLDLALIMRKIIA